jgi:signal transduction histidine kinase
MATSQPKNWGVLPVGRKRKEVGMWEPTLKIEAGPGWLAEPALYENEVQFRRLLEKLPAGAYTCDAEGLITYFNQQAVQLWGRTPKLRDPVDRFCGSFKLFSTDGTPLGHDQCWMALALKMDTDYNGHEIIVERPDGQRLTVLAYANPIHDESGKLLGAVNILVDITERKRVELAQHLLAKASDLLATSLEYTPALTQLAQLVVPGLADWCVIDIPGDSEHEAQVVIAHVDPAKKEMAYAWRRRYPINWNSPRGVAQVVRTGQPELYPEITEAMLQANVSDPEYLHLLRQLQLRSIIIVPLVARGQTLGAMTFIWAESGNHYDEQDLTLAETLVSRAAIALDNARLYEAEQRARQTIEEFARRMTSLQDITAALSEAVASTQVALVIIEKGLPVLGAAGGVITLLNEARTDLEILHFGGYSPELMEKWGRCFPVDTPVPLAEAAQTGTPVFITSLDEMITRYPALIEHRVSDSQAFAALPLSLEGHTIGVLGLSFTRAKIFSEEEREFMLTLARQCAQALERARLYEVEQQARAEAEANQQRLALLAEMRERNRLAQELHDTVAQALGYLNLKIGMTYTSLASGSVDTAKANLQELKQVVGETYTDVREEIFNLRAKVMSGLSFMEVLDRYIDKYRRFYRLEIQLIREVDPALFEFPPEVTSQLIRTIQEALINIRKHAQVNSAIIRLGQENGQIRISVEDQGQGFDLVKIKGKTSSFGLQIMRERVESVGGSLAVDTAPGRGTQIILRYNRG